MSAVGPAAHPFIRIPAVFPAHSTARVLTQRFAGGHGFEWLLAQSPPFQQRIAEILFRFVFGSIFRIHLFNADPHPGNNRFHEDGAVTFLDFGCVKRFTPEMIADWMEIVRAHLRGDKPGFRQQALRLGFLRPDSDLSLDAYRDARMGYRLATDVIVVPISSVLRGGTKLCTEFCEVSSWTDT